MAANGSAQAGQRHPDGHWGKWRGVTCSVEGCDDPAKCKGMCMSHYNRDRWQSGIRPPSITPESRRAARVKHRYGLAHGEYERMVEAQGGVCAVCKQLPSAGNTRAHWAGKLCIDHDHVTGRVRGLLCNDCNLAVGYGKSPAVLRAAADYLQARS
jgi:hypothetical protein